MSFGPASAAPRANQIDAVNAYTTPNDAIAMPQPITAVGQFQNKSHMTAVAVFTDRLKRVCVLCIFAPQHFS